jgi:hypothetical protein
MIKICVVCTKALPKGKRKYCCVACRTKRNNIKYRSRYNEWQNKRLQKKLLASGEALIECAICHKFFRQVGTHIVQKHGYETARDYRADYGYDLKRGQLPEDYRELKAMHVFNNGTVNNLKHGEPYRFKQGDKKAGKYPRSKQTIARLQKHIKTILPT